MNREKAELLEMGSATSLLSDTPIKVNRKVPNDWKLLLTYDEIQRAVKKCARVIDQKFYGKEVVVVGILKGVLPFFVNLVQEMQTEHSWYFIESSSYYNQQKQSKCNIMGSIEPSKFKDKYVVLVDELYDNGLTLSEVKKAVMEKAEVPEDKIFTCTLFKKNKETNYEPPDLFGIEVGDIWLVGMGLDDGQKKRNWKDLYAVPKEEGIPKTEDDNIFDDDKYYEQVRRKLLEQLN